MKIKSVRGYSKNLALKRPYTIAYKTIHDVENIFVEIELENGMIGLGAGSPMTEEMQESMGDAMAVLASEPFQSLTGKDIATFSALITQLRYTFPRQPAALAAIDIALHDAFTQWLGIPLVNFWGRKIVCMPTSITIGIKDTVATLEEAAEYADRGFTTFKVKLGASLEEDIERIVKLREKYGNTVTIRIDVNQGYTPEQATQFYQRTVPLDIELIEQPVSSKNIAGMKSLPEGLRKKIAADESLTSPTSALHLLDSVPACGIFNIKLMKCGGLQAAGEITHIAEAAGIDLMWGCNDESVISISAALHLAFANAHTKYIDLDGSLDLGEDLATGGFVLKNGAMAIDSSLTGLGVKKIN